MAKRFTDSNKWKDSWFQDLPTKYKLFWIYLLDECDAAGIWKPNIRLANFQIGEPFEESEVKRVFSDRIEITDDGYWFIKKFIQFQYGELSRTSKPHLSVIKILEKHKIIGYVKGMDTLKEKEQVKEEEKETVYSIERCKEIALKDDKWVRLNKTNETELNRFNEYLQKQSIYELNPAEYKRYFHHLKEKKPDKVKQKLTIEDYRRMAIEEDQKLKQSA